MKFLKPILTALILTVTLFFSCKKKDVEGTGSSCKLTKSYSYDVLGGGGIDDSAIYSYTNNKVSKVELGGGYYYTLQYNGEYVTRRNNYSGASATPSDFMQVAYNPDNTIQKVEILEKANTGFAITYRLDFVYTSGKLTKINGFDISNNTASKAEEYNYVYTGDNITRATYTDVSTGDTEAISFSYDNTTNYFSKQNIQLLFIDPYLASDGLSLPFIISANNVAGLNYPGIPVPIQVTYQTDDKKNLTAVKVNNQATLGYSYQCQ